jgi:citrate synthase
MISLDPAGLSAVRHDERIGKLERDLAKLEGIVEQLVAGMDAEHQAMKESRKEDRLALKDLGEKMERSISQLAAEMQKMADRNSVIDKGILSKQSQALGAIAVTRWIVGTIISVSVLVVAYSTGRSNRPPEVLQQHGTNFGPNMGVPESYPGQRYPGQR